MEQIVLAIFSKKIKTCLPLQAEGSIFVITHPEGLQKLLEFMKENYQSPKIIITENGITEAKNDKRGLDVALKDPHRIQSILWHLYRIKMAIK